MSDLPPPPASGSAAHVELAGVGMTFGAATALSEVDLRIARGSVHALVGENGAGKSTLGKIVCGALRPTSGALRVDGLPVSLRSPYDALSRGLARISQELAGLAQQSVLDNVFVGVEPRRRLGVVDRGAMRARFDELLESTGLELPADATLGTLGVAEQQKVEIVRALARDARLIVMDEPTAALARPDADLLLDLVRRLAAGGTTIVLVSHFLDDILAVSDTISVLRDGRLVRTSPAAEETPESLVQAMLGRSMELGFPVRRRPPSARTLLEVRDLARDDEVLPSSFAVREGEIVGIAGLMGSGRSELLRLVFGADRPSGGEVLVDGVPVAVDSPRTAVAHGIAMLPESRKTQGLNLPHAIRDNVGLPCLTDFAALGVVRRQRLYAAVGELLDRLDVHRADDALPVGALSGGNQQRVLFAKWLLGRPRVLIVDEPTRGVDVAGKRAIYELLGALADEGLAVVVASSELEEVVGLCDRVYVMRTGQVREELRGDEVTEERVLRAVFTIATEEPVA